MSLSSESGFMEYFDIRINGLRMDNPRGQMESCVDFFVLFKENNEHGEPGVHISIPLDKAKELADGIYDHMPKLVIDLISRSDKNDLEVSIEKINKLADFAIEATGQSDAYLLGMCNGIEYMRATLTGTKPHFFNKVLEQEPRKGHWKSMKGIFESYVKCSICGKCSIDQRTYAAMNFCPNCGADMSEEEK